MAFSFWCVLVGHDDVVARAPERLWLRCAECGRETPGWRLTRSDTSRRMSSRPTPIADVLPGLSLRGEEHRAVA
jgi:hypothetical protein